MTFPCNSNVFAFTYPGDRVRKKKLFYIQSKATAQRDLCGAFTFLATLPAVILVIIRSDPELPFYAIYCANVICGVFVLQQFGAFA